jgi:chaperonin cofactor prefoldin
MSKSPVKENVVVLVDGSGSMGGVISTAVDAVSHAGFPEAFLFNGIGARKLSTSEGFVERLNAGPVFEDQVNKFIQDIMSSQTGKVTKFVIVDDGDTVTQTNGFIAALKKTGATVDVVSIMSSRFPENSSRHFFERERAEKLGVTWQKINEQDSQAVARAIIKAVNNKVIKPKNDNRPQAVKDAERLLDIKLEELSRSSESSERRIKKFEDDIDTLKEHIKSHRKNLRSIKSEFAKVEAARKALSEAKPTRQRAVKKAAPKK